MRQTFKGNAQVVLLCEAVSENQAADLHNSAYVRTYARSVDLLVLRQVTIAFIQAGADQYAKAHPEVAFEIAVMLENPSGALTRLDRATE